MIRLNTPIESLVINLQSAGNVQYNIQYVIVRQGTRLEKSTEGLLTSSGQNVVLINDFSSGYFDITYINVTNIDPTENFISVLKKTNVSEFNLTSEAIGLKNRECTEFTSESGFKVLDQNGSFKTITESVSADGDVENSDMTYMASVPSGGTLTLPDSDIEVNGVGEGVVVSVKTISVDLNDGTDPVSPTLVTLLGNTLTITLPDIGDVTVENSDATYQVIEPSGGTLVLPDSQINFNGVDEGDVVSVKAINVDLTDGVDPIVPTSVGLVGNTLTITLPASSDVDIEINGVPYDTITAPATIDIPVINSVPAPVGTIVGTDIIVGDSSAVIKDSIGTTLKTEAIPAEASENITINNSTVNIRDTAANLLHAVSVRAEATTTQDIADTTVENSDASYSVDVLAEGSLILPDSQINVNSVDSGDVVSVKTIDVNLEDSLGAPVVPTSVGLVGNTLTIEVPSGATPMDVDFSADKLTAVVGENITFTDLSDQSPTHWSWRFSDGTTSIVQNPVKSFTTLGFKNITLMAGKVGAGGVNIKNSYIEILGSLLLDAFPNAAAAYSLRKLRGAYTGSAVRVRRSSDNTEQDIGFNSLLELDTTALLSFVGAGNGFVTTWYDQSGNANNATQTTATKQPLIVNSGSVLNLNSKPCLSFDGVNSTLLNNTLTASSTQSVFYVKKGANINNNSTVFGFPTTQAETQLGIYYWDIAPFTYGFNTWSSDSYGYSGANTEFLSQTLEMALFKNGNPTTSGVKLFINNIEKTLSQLIGSSSSRTMGNGLRIGVGGNDNNQNYDGFQQELVIYSQDYSITNRVDIQANINAYYNVF